MDQIQQVILHYTETWPLKMLIVTLLVLIFIIAAMALIVYLIFIRGLRRIRAYRRRRQQAYYKKTLSKFLLDELDETAINYDEAVVQSFRRYFKKNRFSKKVLYWLLLDAHKSFSGETARKLRIIFHRYGLDHFALYELQKGKLYDKAQAMLVLSSTKHERALDKIKKYLNHKNDTVRISAQVSYMRLREEEPLQFLHRLRQPLNRWHQIQLMEALKKLDKRNIPNFARFFDHPEPSVISFCLMMTAHFNQFTHTDAIANCLHHAQERVRIAAIRAIGKMGLDEYSDQLVMHLGDQFATKERMAVFQALKQLKDEAGLPIARQMLNANQAAAAVLQAAIDYHLNVGNEAELVKQVQQLKAQKVMLDQIKAFQA